MVLCSPDRESRNNYTCKRGDSNILEEYEVCSLYKCVFRSFRTESITKYTLTFGITR
jgi:hypothetical protein